MTWPLPIISIYHYLPTEKRPFAFLLPKFSIFHQFRRTDEKVVMNLNPPFPRLLCSYFICRLTRIDWLCEITGHHRMIDINFVRKTMIALCICMNIDIEIYTFVSICIQKRRGGERFLFPIWLQRIFFSFIDFVVGDKEVSFFIRRFQSLTLFVKK